MDDTEPTNPLDPRDPRFDDTNPLRPSPGPAPRGAADPAGHDRDPGRTPPIPEEKLTLYGPRGPSRSSPAPRIPGFEVIKKLGRGGIGIVWLVRHVRLNRLVALKMLIDPEAPANDRERFRREGEAMARLDDPGIVKVFAVEDFLGEPFLVMEYCSGRTLADYLRKKPQDPRTAAEIALKLVRAVGHAHGRGVYHRDLKPQNIMLLHPVESDLDAANRTGTPTGATPPTTRPFSPELLRVCDFGLARLLDDTAHLTFTRDILGTPSYMSPEQASGGATSPDGRSDIWSLGVILYETLTGSVPFVGPSYPAILEQVKHKTPVPPSRKLDVPQDLELICLHCLEKLPENRYRDAAALEKDLTAFLDNRPISVRPISRFERGVRWVRRNPAWSGMVALVVGVLALGTVVSTLLALDANRHAGRAEENERLALDEKKKAEAAAKKALDEARRAELNQSVARLRFADQRFAEGGVVLARSELARIPVEHRGFEWGHRQRLYSGGYATLCGHTSRINGIRYSRDGSKIFSAGGCTIRIWDARTGEPKGVITSVSLPGHSDEILDADISPDGSRIASCGKDGFVRIWNADTRGLLRAIPTHADTAKPVPVRKVRFRPDGRTLLAASSDGMLRAIDTAEGRQIFGIRVSPAIIRALALTPDGRTVAASGDDGKVRVYDADTGEKLAEFRPTEFEILALSFHPDGRRLLCGDAAGNCRIVLASDGRELERFRDHANAVLGAEFSPDGYRLATAGYDKLLVVREVGREFPIQTLRGNTDSVSCVSFRPDGLQVCTGTLDATLKLWDAVQNDSGLTFHAHAGGVQTIHWAARSERIFSSGDDGKVRAWDAVDGRQIAEYDDHDGPVLSVCCSAKGDRLLTTGKDLSTLLRDLEADKILWIDRSETAASAAAFSPDGRRVLVRYEDGSVRVLSAADGGVEVKIEPLAVADRKVFAIAFSHSGEMFAVGHEDSRIRVYDTHTGQPLRAPLCGHTNAVSGLGFSPDDEQLVSASTDQSLRIWDLRTGEVVRELLGHTDYPNGVRISNFGSRILSIGSRGSVKLWDSKTGEMLLDVRSHSGRATDCDFSPDGTRIASSGGDGTIRIISSKAMQNEVELRGHTNRVTTLSYSPDSLRLVSGGLDNVARVWDLASGNQWMELTGHTDRVWSVAWSPDGKLIATSSEDKTVRLWDASTGEYLRNLPGHGGQGSVAVFSPDSRQLYTSKEDGDERMVRDVETGSVESRPKYPPAWAIRGNTTAQVSPDGLRFARTEAESRIVQSVGLKVDSEEMAYRLSCASPTHRRFAEEANAAKQRRAWGAVRFYAAAMLRLQPNDSKAKELLAEAANPPKAE